jgi:Na+-driven multidrug efflux pump
MYTATTNLVAGAKETDSENGKDKTKETMIHAITLSGYVGAVRAFLSILFAKPLLRLIIGNDSIDAQVFQAATRYVRIRALGMPAAVIIGSAQSACLGLQDIRSPFYVLVAAALVNFCGDMCFVGNKHHLIGGAAGAAWATTFSQYFAVIAFMKWLTLSTTSTTSSSNLDFVKKPTARGFLSEKLKFKDFMQLPDRKALGSFWPFFLPVTMTSIGRVSAYVAMSHVVSSSLGTLSMAANQIILSLFYCLTPVADSLNLTAQSFIPPLFEKKKSPLRTQALRKSLRSFIYAAVLFGAALSCSVCVIPLFSNLFTSDGLVMSQVNAIIPYLFGVFSVHGVICAGEGGFICYLEQKIIYSYVANIFVTSDEGFLLGCKDLNFLSRMYAMFFVTMPYFMLRVKWAARLGQTVDLSSVWRVFMGYQIFRSTAWFTRLLFLQNRREREVENST